MLGVALCETESLGPRVAYCLDGNPADMGESAFGLKLKFAEDSSLSKPSPAGNDAGSSGGGVGVRGGTGRGIFDVISVTEVAKCKKMTEGIHKESGKECR